MTTISHTWYKNLQSFEILERSARVEPPLTLFISLLFLWMSYLRRQFSKNIYRTERCASQSRKRVVSLTKRKMYGNWNGCIGSGEPQQTHRPYIINVTTATRRENQLWLGHTFSINVIIPSHQGSLTKYASLSKWIPTQSAHSSP